MTIQHRRSAAPRVPMPEDPWASQEYRREVWISRRMHWSASSSVCSEYDVPYQSTRGSNSHSNMYEAGQRFAEIVDQDQIPLVLHLADHDPTGLHMTEDVINRLERYAYQPIEVRRLGLTFEQAREYRLPGKPGEGNRQPLSCLSVLVRLAMLGARCIGAIGDYRPDPHPA